MGPVSHTEATRVHATRVPPALPPGEVHLWVVNLDSGGRGDVSVASESSGPASPQEAARRRAATSVAERERAARLTQAGDGERYLAAHGALRLILGDYLACDPLALRFETGAWGKPGLVGAALQFNLSHSGALALIAVAHHRQVGVDIERLRPIADLDGVAARICTPREQEALDAVAAPEREGAFLALWTRKEALAKMTGEGVRALGRDSSVDVGPHWRLVQVQDLPGYAACIAAEGAEWRLERRV